MAIKSSMFVRLLIEDMTIMRRFLVICIGIILLGCLPYVLLSTSVLHPLSASEYVIFSEALAAAGLGHISENGGPRAFALATEALRSPVTQWRKTIGTHEYIVPLPPYTVAAPNRSDAYITFATAEQLQTYYTTAMARAGWIGNGRMGATHEFSNGPARLGLDVTYYLSSNIRQIDISLNGIS
jgi:hypothetical protein